MLKVNGADAFYSGNALSFQGLLCCHGQNDVPEAIGISHICMFGLYFHPVELLFSKGFTVWHWYPQKVTEGIV